MSLRRINLLIFVCVFALLQVFLVAADAPVGPQLSVNYADANGNALSNDPINYRQIDTNKDLICSINYVVNRQTGEWDYVNDPAEDVFVYYWKRLGHTPIQGRILPSALTNNGEVWNCDVYGVVGNQNNVLLLGSDQYFNVYMSDVPVDIPAYLDAFISPQLPTTDDDLTCGSTEESDATYVWYEYTSLTNFPTMPYASGFTLANADTTANNYYQCVAAKDGLSSYSNLAQVDVSTSETVQLTALDTISTSITCDFVSGTIDSSVYDVHWSHNGALTANTGNTLSAATFGGFVEGDIWTCDVVTDMYNLPVGSATQTVSAPPAPTPVDFDNFTITPVTGDTSSSFVFTIDYVDPTDDNIISLSANVANLITISDVSGDIVSSGDGVYSDGETFVTTPLASLPRGNQNVTFTVATADGRTYSETFYFTVDNFVPLIGGVNVNSYVVAGDIITLNFSVIDLDNDALTYNLVSTGSIFPAGIVQDTLEANVYTWQTTPFDGGVYPLQFQVNDSIDVATFNFTINVTNGAVNEAPVVTLLSPTDGSNFALNDSVTFSVYAFDTEDGELTGNNISWYADNGVGIFANGNLVTVTLDDSLWTNGTYQIAAVATDSFGLEGTAVLTINVVEEHAPVITIVSPNDNDVFKVGDAITFEASATDIEDGTLPSNAFTWVSSINNVIGVGDNLSMIIDGNNLDVGIHNITVTAVDSQGLTSENSFKIIVLPGDFEDIDVMISIAPLAGENPFTIAYNAIPVGGIPTSYVWDFDSNGRIDSWNKSGSFTYHESGEYVVKLIAQFGEGADLVIINKSLTVTVEPSADAPRVKVETSDLSGGYPLSVKFDTEIKGDGPFTLMWDYDGDGDVDDTFTSVLSRKSVTHNYNKAGEYEAELIVYDAAGISTRKTFAITVENRKPDAHFGRIVQDEFYTPGEMAKVSIKFDNIGNIKLENVKMTVIVDELGLMSYVGPFDITRSGDEIKTVYLEIPAWAPKGNYDMVVYLSNDEMTRTKYRTLTIQ